MDYDGKQGSAGIICRFRWKDGVYGLRALFVLTVLFAFPWESYGDIYRYVDKNGVLHFTNVPSTPGYTLHRPGLGGGYEIKYSSYNSDQYDHLISEASKRYGVSFPIVKAIIKAESSFNPRAVSKKGAVGLMQIMPQNFKPLNIRNPYDPKDNILGGTRYFRHLLDFFGGKLTHAVAGYNAGPNSVVKYNGIPPYKETKTYVKKVIRYYRDYSN